MGHSSFYYFCDVNLNVTATTQHYKQQKYQHFMSEKAVCRVNSKRSWKTLDQITNTNLIHCYGLFPRPLCTLLQIGRGLGGAKLNETGRQILEFGHNSRQYTAEHAELFFDLLRTNWTEHHTELRTCKHPAELTSCEVYIRSVNILQS